MWPRKYVAQALINLFYRRWTENQMEHAAYEPYEPRHLDPEGHAATSTGYIGAHREDR